MSKEDRFLTFPIEALRMGKSLNDVTATECKDQLNRIMNYAGYHLGNSAWDSIVKNGGDPNMEALEAGVAFGIVVGKLPQNQRKLLLGFRRLGVIVYPTCNLSRDLSCANEIEKKANSGMLVRLSRDHFFHFRDHDTDWRKLAILCAIYGGIGSYKSRLLTIEYIQCLALGYASYRDLEACGAKQFYLPYRQVTRTRDSLYQSNYFMYGSPNKRHNYYSIRMDQNEFIANMADHRPKRLLPSQITAAIKQKKEASVNA